MCMCDVSGGGGIAIKEFEEDWGREALEVLGSEHYQGFIDKVIGGSTVNQGGDGVGREEEGGAEDVGGV
ncbi:hypothetical protein C0989_008388 [Termitomyces sp. Mn162]|nr:hypothetical protein C0989_008388 [Termitomyces sp. Mn162]